MIIADTLVALAVVGLIVLFFYGPWQWICADVAAQMISERRSKLFDLAAASRLDFTSAQYRTIRQSMDAMISFAHNLTWPRLLFIAVFTSSECAVSRAQFGMGKTRLGNALASIEDVKAREQVANLVDESGIVLFGMMCMKSIFVAPLAVPFLGLVGLLSRGREQDDKYHLNSMTTHYATQDSVVRNVAETIQVTAENVAMVPDTVPDRDRVTA